MIRILNGVVNQSSGRYITLLTTSGVGYMIFVPSRAIYNTNDQVTLHTHLAVRETALDLYGFSSYGELKWFELLLTIPKIGPKSALQILDQATPDLLLESISQNDPSYLAKLSGIGKKTAEKIVQELATKIPSDLVTQAPPVRPTHYQDAFDTLITLGYSPTDIRPVLDELSEDTTSALVTQALKQL